MTIRHPFRLVLAVVCVISFAVSCTAAEEAETALKTISFAMPADGYISLNIRTADGVVVRQLLNCEPMSKGNHDVAWDGLTTPIWKTPGRPVPPGSYTWSGIWHPGIGLRLRGWAYHGQSDPWDVSPTTYWGADHALPVACVADALDLKPANGLSLRGDFGATRGDKAGGDAAIRTYWNNQQTDIVNDEVFELKLEPRN